MTKTTFTSTLILCSALFISGEASALCVTASKANLRSEPSSRSSKSWTVGKYMPLQQLLRKGNWYHVKDVDGDRHWIHRSLVTASMRCAVVKKKTATMRSGPSTRHAKLPWSPVSKYYTGRVIQSKGRWVKVQDFEQDKGWIAKSRLWIQ